ncbi:hypothetical protein T492DRAFT_886341 [Pavlovales sp. CCMP2436]|nr:hypothetical protein T492DRAFT_886341 [Pavlovales sp. CCMP2436]
MPPLRRAGAAVAPSRRRGARSNARPGRRGRVDVRPSRRAWAEEETEEGGSASSTVSSYSMAGNVLAQAIEMQQGAQQRTSQRATRCEQARAHYSRARARLCHWSTPDQRAKLARHWHDAVRQAVTSRRARAARSTATCEVMRALFASPADAPMPDALDAAALVAAPSAHDDPMHAAD